jgi:polyhydroxybutyrate depolymerase
MNEFAKCFIFAVIALISVLPAPAQDTSVRERSGQALENGKAASSAPSSREEGTTAITIQSGGVSRVYHIHVPAAYDSSKPSPLLFAFHGAGGTGIGMAKLSKMNRESDKQGSIVVYPDGLQRHWNDGRIRYATQRHQDDVGFVRDILKKLENEMNIDKARIYVCGMSNGGLFSQRLICEVPDIFAAAASVAATFPADNSIAPSKPFSIMYMLGKDDPIMPFEGGDIRIFRQSRGKVLSGDQSVATWVKYDDCPLIPSVSTYGERGANLSIDSKTYGPGKSGSEVVYCVVQGGGHCWPGGWQYMFPKIIGYTSPINANDIIWHFFSRHKLEQ